MSNGFSPGDLTTAFLLDFVNVKSFHNNNTICKLFIDVEIQTFMHGCAKVLFGLKYLHHQVSFLKDVHC